MRAASSLLGIIAVFIGLLTGPFFHIHSEGGEFHNPGDVAELHTHFTDAVSDDHSADSQELEIRGEHERHHGEGVSVLAANARRAQHFVAVLQAVRKVDEPSSVFGNGIEIPERVQESPSSGSSNPRSPPA